MLGGLGLVAGLILLLVSPPLFAAAHTVGTVLLLADVVPWAIALVVFTAAALFGTRSVKRW